jgi:hypothetical protein
VSRNSAGDLVWREGLLAVHAALSLTESTEPGTSPSAESTARDVIDTIRADGDRYAQVCSEAAELRVATHGITSVPSEDVIREHAEAGGKWTLVGCSDPAYNRAFMGKYEALNAARSLRRSAKGRRGVRAHGLPDDSGCQRCRRKGHAMSRARASDLYNVWSMRGQDRVRDARDLTYQEASKMIGELNRGGVAAIAVRRDLVVLATGHVNAYALAHLHRAALNECPSTRGGEMLARCAGTCSFHSACGRASAPWQQRLAKELRPLCAIHRSMVQTIIASDKVAPETAITLARSREAARSMRRFA